MRGLNMRGGRIDLYYIWECGLVIGTKGLLRPLRVVQAGQLQL